MPADYTHTAIANGATLSATTFNTDHENHITNRVAEKMGGYSTDVEEMQYTFDPGEVAGENLPQTMADEIGALRKIIEEIKGIEPWYQSLTTRIDQLGWNFLLNPTGINFGLDYLSSTEADTRRRMTWVVPQAYAGGDVTLRLFIHPRFISASFPTGVAVLRVNRLVSSSTTNQQEINCDQTYTSVDDEIRLITATIAEANVPSVGDRLILDFQRLGTNASDSSLTETGLLAASVSYSAYAGRGV